MLPNNHRADLPTPRMYNFSPRMAYGDTRYIRIHPLLNGREAPAPVRDEVYNRVRLAASVAYLEAGEDILRTQLSALVEGGASELFVAHDAYSFHRPAQTWERVKLPPQYECGASGRGRR